MSQTTAGVSRLEQLLEKTSRTFALAIPLLPEPRRREVTVAYLLFRIADTFEDAARWAAGRRIAALEYFCRLLDRPDAGDAEAFGRRCSRESPVQHEGYLELLEAAPLVLEGYRDLAAPARELVRSHTIRTAQGMADFVGRTDERGVLRLESLADLRAYCYVVAGIVGEMLTELFLLDGEHLSALATYLRKRARFFGEGLQLVNVVKDSSADAREGRLYLPPAVSRDEVFDLAYRDLHAATEYTLALQEAGAPDGLVAFNALPVRLALATLEKVRSSGPGAKISRVQVRRIVTALSGAIERGRPAVPLAPWPHGAFWSDDWQPAGVAVT